MCVRRDQTPSTPHTIQTTHTPKNLEKTKRKKTDCNNKKRTTTYNKGVQHTTMTMTTTTKKKKKTQEREIFRTFFTHLFHNPHTLDTLNTHTHTLKDTQTKQTLLLLVSCLLIFFFCTTQLVCSSSKHTHSHSHTDHIYHGDGGSTILLVIDAVMHITGSLGTIDGTTNCTNRSHS